MTIIRTPEPDEVAGDAAELYAEDLQAIGYVPSHTRVMATNPAAVRAFENLIRASIRTMDLRRYELVTLAAAQAIGSRACRLAHGRKSLKVFDENQLERIARDFHDAGLSEAEVAMMDFAQKLSHDSASMTDADSLRLRELGFSDDEIVDIALAAAARNFYSRALHALAVPVDVPPDLSPALRDALVDGV
ncbi:carboxymuconolactone decarboxylase family protein [Protaetiibacter mangrovi]|uniref:Carboxymuconolactone decarboxylase family protein n=1 Tax=Protaetiibacter mangrovi TaxID=2970926 RepID=A0ABT1ZE63_9MICO|nr:carboxymuconolactone decarboxylase family protein [Protaetiibacter mangrovi]MCS0498971.1 carboxymuconolactone decarboxylase family protein [Protaetiibacter mangrovi]TPX02991.1 carboxymuconolactone decarboxylase family protein [Schumannella luteola]